MQFLSFSNNSLLNVHHLSQQRTGWNESKTNHSNQNQHKPIMSNQSKTNWTKLNKQTNKQTKQILRVSTAHIQTKFTYNLTEAQVSRPNFPRKSAFTSEQGSLTLLKWLTAASRQLNSTNLQTTRWLYHLVIYMPFHISRITVSANFRLLAKRGWTPRVGGGPFICMCVCAASVVKSRVYGTFFPWKLGSWEL